MVHIPTLYSRDWHNPSLWIKVEKITLHECKVFNITSNGEIVEIQEHELITFNLEEKFLALQGKRVLSHTKTTLN